MTPSHPIPATMAARGTGFTAKVDRFGKKSARSQTTDGERIGKSAHIVARQTESTRTGMDNSPKPHAIRPSPTATHFGKRTPSSRTRRPTAVPSCTK